MFVNLLSTCIQIKIINSFETFSIEIKYKKKKLIIGSTNYY